MVEPASNTVNTATVTAAAARVVGNDKVPDVAASSGIGQFTPVYAFKQFIETTTAEFNTLKQNIDAINAKYQAITQDQWNVLNNEAVVIRASVRARVEDLSNSALKALDGIPSSGQTYNQKNALRQYDYTLDNFKSMTTLSEEIRKLIKILANKIYSFQIIYAKTET